MATTAGEQELSLLDCDREPIRTPGGIQPRGVLLGVDEHDLRIAFASENASTFFGLPADDLLGRLLSEVSRDPIGETARTLLADRATRPMRLGLVGRRPVDVFAHRSGAYVLVELEDVDEDEIAASDGSPGDVLETLGRFQDADSVHALLESAVSIIQDITGFDRVLAYRFEADGHGIVENERLTPGLAPLLGLHFPASDIPAQARALYREQWIRVIPDSSASAMALTGIEGAPPPDGIDLSRAVLRAVSPIHLAYLRNMGVRASMSISLIVNGSLWGLIVCHHYRGARLVSDRLRTACEVVGITASMSIATKAELAIAERRLELERIAAALLERVAGAASVPEGLLEEPALLLGICDATGAALRIGGVLARVGSVPDEEGIDRIQQAIADRLDASAEFATSQLAVEYPALSDLSEVASGVLAMNLSSDGTSAILWFRSEVVGTVTWAGEPQKLEQVGSDGTRSLGPRRSFDAWAEIVRDHSAPWDSAEIAAVTTLRATLGTFLLERAEQHALALESARRFDREHYIAQTLMQGLKPAPLPVTPGLDVRALYLPAGRGYGVSGDFFDVFPAGGGWFAVIGDVCGKGPPAAALTALARHSIRAVVAYDSEIAPSRVMSVLNETFMERAGGLFATVQIARITPAPGDRMQVALCSAGHPPALHRHGARVTPRSSRNILVAARRGLSYSDIEFELVPDDALILYTDGVTEAGRPNTLVGEQPLADAISDAGEGAASAAVLHAVERLVRAHEPGELRDDIAVLCLRAQGPG
jgi:chemotaxis family two-component system sensor kinase Cph1